MAWGENDGGTPQSGNSTLAGENNIADTGKKTYRAVGNTYHNAKDTAGKVKRATGRVKEVAGKAKRATGKVAQTAGKGVEYAGKGLKLAGNAAQTGGNALKAAGTAANAIPVIGTAAGAVLGGTGTLMNAAGKGAKTLGQGAENVGGAINRFGKKFGASFTASGKAVVKDAAITFAVQAKSMMQKIILVFAILLIAFFAMNAVNVLEKIGAFLSFGQISDWFMNDSIKKTGINGQSLAVMTDAQFDKMIASVNNGGEIEADPSLTEEEKKKFEEENKARKLAIFDTTIDSENARIIKYYQAERDSVLKANDSQGDWLSTLWSGLFGNGGKVSGERFSFKNDDKDFNGPGVSEIKDIPSFSIADIKQDMTDQMLTYVDNNGSTSTTPKDISMGNYIFSQMDAYALKWKLLYLFDKAFDDLVGENTDNFEDLTTNLEKLKESFFRDAIPKFMSKYEFQRHLKKVDKTVVTVTTDAQGKTSTSTVHTITYTPVYFMTRVEMWNKIMTVNIEEDVQTEHESYGGNGSSTSITTITTTPIPGAPSMEDKKDDVQKFLDDHKLVYNGIEYKLDNDKIEAALSVLAYVPSFYSVRYDVASTFNIELEQIGYLGFGGNYTIPEDQRQFVESLRPFAAQIEAETGVPAAITIAQACLETGYGQYVPKDMNSGLFSYNLFGIKQFGDGPYVECWTTEYYGGSLQKVVAKFIAYPSFEGSVRDHAVLLLGPTYAKCMAVKNDPVRFAMELQNAGYATDPNYAQKLISIMMQFNLLLPFDNSYHPVLPVVDPNNITRQDMLKVASAIMGHNYLWGGKWPYKGLPPASNGLDCSGYVQWAYVNTFGKQIGSGGGTADIYNSSTQVYPDSLQIGDLGLLNGTGADDHVGIFIGRDPSDGTPLFIHDGGKYYGDAMHPNGKVLISRLNNPEAGGNGGEYMGNKPVRFYKFVKANFTFKD